MPARIGASAASAAWHPGRTVYEAVGHIAADLRQAAFGRARCDRPGALGGRHDRDRAARGLRREPGDRAQSAADRDGLDHARVQVAQGRTGRPVRRLGSGDR